jgi:hypothetical protein
MNISGKFDMISNTFINNFCIALLLKIVNRAHLAIAYINRYHKRNALSLYELVDTKSSEKTGRESTHKKVRLNDKEVLSD